MQVVNLVYAYMPELWPHFELHLMGEVHQIPTKLKDTRMGLHSCHCYTQMLPDWNTKSLFTALWRKRV